MQCWQLAAPRAVNCPPRERVSRKVPQSYVGVSLGNGQPQVGDRTEAALQSHLSLIVRPLDSLVLVCVCEPVVPPPQDDTWASPFPVGSTCSGTSKA